MSRIILCVDHDRLTGGYQLSINEDQGNGIGNGYRIAGPKYCGKSVPIIEHELTDSDVYEIRRYLRRRATLKKKAVK